MALWHQDSSSVAGEKWSDSVYILRVEPVKNCWWTGCGCEG